MYKGIRFFDLYHLFMGVKSYNHGNYKEAQKILSTIIKKNSNSAYLNFKYGMCWYKQSEWSDALIYFEKAKISQGYFEKWDKQYHTALKNAKNDNKINISDFKKEFFNNKYDLDSLLKYAESLYQNKSYWQAIKILEDHLKITQTEIKEKYFYFLLGLLYLKFKNYDTASYHFKQAHLLDPSNRDYAYKYAYSLEHSGHIDKSFNLYNEIDDNSSVESLECGEGLLHAKSGLWKEATIAYEKRISDYQIDQPLIYEKLAYAYGRLYLWDKAAINYQNAIKFSSIPNATLYYKCAESHEKNDNYEQAAHYYQLAVDRSDDYKDYWYYRYAYALQKLNKYEEASIIFESSRKRTLPYAIDPKHVIKNSKQALLAQYTEYYETLEIRETTILFESYFGNNISCNPYAILKQLLGNSKFNHFKFVCIITKNTSVPPDLLYDDRLIFVKRGTDLYLRYLASAKYLINNVSFPFYFIRKKEQVYLNTWHGTPIKTLGKDIKKPFLDHSNVARNFLQCTHIISPNRYTTDIILDKYDIRHLYSGMIGETGYPRVDLTLNVDDHVRQKMINELGLRNDLPIILYAPTWRGTSDNKFFNLNKLKQDLRRLKSSKYQLVFKAHHLVEEPIQKANLDIKLAPSYIDTNILLGCIDGLISDYSSIVFDFIKTNKPIFSYVADYDIYLKERGLYFEREKLPGIICNNIHQLKKNIIHNICNKQFLNDNMTSQEYSSLDDGNSTKRVVDFVFNEDVTHVHLYSKKNVCLLFNGSFLSNGITSSFNNLIFNLIDNPKINKSLALTVVVNRNDLVSDITRTSKFNELPIDDLCIIARSGSMLMTIEEIWIRNKFDESFELYSNNFKEKLFKIYEREVKRLFGTSVFQSIINFEGYSVFWNTLLSRISANNKLIFLHNDLYREWKSKYPYLEAIFKTYDAYNKIVSVSEVTSGVNRDNLSSLFDIDSEKFVYSTNTILPNEIITKSFNDENMNQLFTDFQGKRILNIGRLSHEKDQEKLIRAFAKSASNYDDIRLFIIGSGPLEETLKSLIVDLNLEDRIFLLGQIENPYPYLRQADLFILSSNHEGQPMVLLEAMVLKKPIIATDIPANRHVLNDNTYGSLVDNSEEGISIGINDFLQSGIVYQEFDYDSYNNHALESFISLLDNRMV